MSQDNKVRLTPTPPSFGQYQLVRHLVWGHRNLCCVGSPVQAIYSWRGADIANMLHRFHADFPTAAKVVLHTNYRCTANILHAAQQVVQDLPYREELTTSNAAGDPISVASLHTDWDESTFVAAEVQRLVRDKRYRFEDCAVLFRTRVQGRLFEQVMMHLGLPYTLVGDFRFFERREIKDLLAYLRLIHDRYDAGALQRIVNRPPRGLGSAALAKLQRGAPELTFDALTRLDDREDLPERVKEATAKFAELVFHEFPFVAKEKGLADLIDHVLEHSGYREWVKRDPEAKPRLANLAQLRLLAGRYEGVSDALSSFLADIATMGNEDIGIPLDAHGVTLATVHAVKGLEFPVVFMAGLEDGILPHAKALRTPGGIEEEQRLVYVGMTRAMTKLYLTYARTRQAGTSAVECTPSRFLTMLPRALVERVSTAAPATVSLAPMVDKSPEIVEDKTRFPTRDSEAPAEAEERLPQITFVVAPDEKEPPPESAFDRWLAESQSAWLECEVGRAEEREAAILAELEDDDTDLEAEILAEVEMHVSEEVEARLREAQKELLAYEMSLAEIAYEREREAPSRSATSVSSIETAESGEEETEDFDALLQEYAEEIAAHEREKVQTVPRQRTEVSYALAD